MENKWKSFRKYSKIIGNMDPLSWDCTILVLHVVLVSSIATYRRSLCSLGSDSRQEPPPPPPKKKNYYIFETNLAMLFVYTLISRVVCRYSWGLWIFDRESIHFFTFENQLSKVDEI